MLGMRFAQDKLRQMDDAYALGITHMYLGTDEKPKHVGNKGMSTAAGLATTFGGGVPISSWGENAATNGAVISSAAARYVAPAVGVTLAGKALLDLTNDIGTQGELPMS